jgi:hypothetical protein
MLSAANPVTSTNPPALTHTLTTLDEPVSETLKRDLRGVGVKLKYVLMPRISEEEAIKELRKWDLWGPLLLCMILSIVLSVNAPGQSETVFAQVFVIVWGGAAVVTLNGQLLGGKVSFFQSVCVLGYCIFPIVLSSFLCLAWDNRIWRVIVVGGAFVWSTRASVVFMSQLVNPERKVLAAYPVFLFYLVLSWFVFIL